MIMFFQMIDDENMNEKFKKQQNLTRQQDQINQSEIDDIFSEFIEAKDYKNIDEEQQEQDLIIKLENSIKIQKRSFEQDSYQQSERYKGYLIGIKCQNTKIIPFYAQRPCFENLDSIICNKQDLNDIQMLEQKSNNNDTLNKYHILVNKDEFDLIINCMKKKFNY
ncbi:hypothetical protein ABPG72_013258 [Tetrahymena utriculariae]